MSVTVRWDRDSEQWIGRLSKFADLLVPGVRGACARVAAHTVSRVRQDIPVFEGDLRDDFRVLSMRRRQGNGNILGGFSVGFTSATVMPAVESLDSNSRPFAIGWGKHSPGAEAHNVMLYNPRTGGSRAKLIRYLKKTSPDKYGDLPDDASKQDVEDWQRDTRKATGWHPKPYVMVDPQASAEDFLWHLMADEGDPLLGELVEQIWNQVAMVWSK